MELDWRNRDSCPAQSKQGTSPAAGIGNNLPYLRNRKVAARFGYLAGFIVNDPVADAGFNATQVLAGKLIAFSRAVIVEVRPIDG